MNNTCFVIMPIGTQQIGGHTITEEELKKNTTSSSKKLLKNLILLYKFSEPTKSLIQDLLAMTSLPN